MSHELHGFTHAYSPQEVKANQKNGWKIASEHKPEKKEKEVPTDELKAKYFKVFGKKPHHMMNRHNIAKAIKEVE
jgi:hypothetical protein